MNPLNSTFKGGNLEAGCDEAGRGCLAGPVFAAAVILRPDKIPPGLNDSKKLSAVKRDKLRKLIEDSAFCWSVKKVSPATIDKINILNASFKAMNRAIGDLPVKPNYLLVDGNRFQNELGIPYSCIVGGDSKYASIAAASILAKTHRDEFMISLHKDYPLYGWDRNKGYPTAHHRLAVIEHGKTPHHRKTFQVRIQGKFLF